MIICLFKQIKWKQPDFWGFYKLHLRELLLNIIKCLLLLSAVAYLFFNNLLFIFFFLPYLYIYLKKKFHEYVYNEKKQLNTQFKDGMISVSFALNAGYSIENSFREAMGDLRLLYGNKSPIVIEFQSIINKMNRNENIEDILDDFARRSEIEDISYFTEVFRYAKRSGGDLIAIIKNTTFIIREKQEVLMEIDTVVSGKKLEQKVMSVIPFGIIVYLKLASPEFIAPLYGNLTGIAIMTICLCVYTAAIALAEKIVHIEI